MAAGLSLDPLREPAALPDSLAGLRELTSKGRGMGREWREGRKGRTGEGRKGTGKAPSFMDPSYAPGNIHFVRVVRT